MNLDVVHLIASKLANLNRRIVLNTNSLTDLSKLVN